MRNYFVFLCVVLILNFNVCIAHPLELSSTSLNGIEEQKVEEKRVEEQNILAATKTREDPKSDNDAETYKIGGSGGMLYRPKPPVNIGNAGALCRIDLQFDMMKSEIRG